MVATAQMFVQRRFHALLMFMIGLGFLLILAELIGYQHFKGLQLLGTGATVVGALTAFIGIGARGNLRRILAGVFLVLALVGIVGVVEHNGDRLRGEQGQGQFQGGRSGQDANRPNDQGQPPDAQGGFGSRIPPPPLAPLSLAGFCTLGAIALLGKKDDLTQE